MAIAMNILVPIRTGRSLPATARRQGVPIFASGLLQTASTAFFIIAIDLTTIANAVVIFAAAPVIAALLARFAIGERTKARTWTGIAGSIAGILVVVWGSFGAGSVQGDLFAVAAIVSFGANLTLWRRYPELNRQVVIGLGGLGLALISVIPANPGALDARAMVILAIMGLATGPAGRVAIATSTRYLPVSQVSLFTPVETVAAIAWAWIFLSEAPGAPAIIGGMVVIASIIYGVAWNGDSEPAVL